MNRFLQIWSGTYTPLVLAILFLTLPQIFVSFKLVSDGAEFIVEGNFYIISTHFTETDKMIMLIYMSFCAFIAFIANLYTSWKLFIHYGRDGKMNRLDVHFQLFSIITFGLETAQIIAQVNFRFIKFLHDKLEITYMAENMARLTIKGSILV